MRRPLCVFCAGTLGLELVCAFLPQTGRFVPFAAFFIAGLLWALAGRLRKSPAWGYGICLILGAIGIANMWMAIFADVGVMIIAVLNAIRALFVKKL